MGMAETQQQGAVITELIDLPEKCTSFLGKSGRRYIVRSMVNTDAYAILQQLELEIQSGHSVGDIVKLQGKAIKALQSNGDVYNASVHLYNATNAAERIQELVPTAWLLELTLFVRPEGTDVTEWDETQAKEWISDWGNYTLSSLFFCRNTCLEALGTSFSPSTPTTSSEQSGQSEENTLSETTEQA